MIHFWKGFVVVLCALPCFAQAPAAGSESLAVHGSIRTRLEAWDWFDGAGNSTYAFSGNQLRLSVGQTRKRFDWQLEVEAPLLFGLPDDAVAPGAQGQLGLGASYSVANDRSTNAAMVFVKQGFYRRKWGAQSLRLGRFEFSDGAETTPANATLAWVKRERVSQRLIGPFGWSHVGRSFDGAHYVWNGKNNNLTIMGARPTRGAFQVDGWGELDVALGYAAFTNHREGARGGSEFRVFGAWYHDWRNVLKTDNRPAPARALDRQNVRIASIGWHGATATQTRKAGAFDSLIWYVGQLGRWGRLSHVAYALDIEVGWQPPVLSKLKPWLRAGYSRSSGDRDPNDDTHGTYFQMLPTPRPYARTPFFNMMNNEDIMGMLMLRPHKAVTIRSEAHRLNLVSRADPWYAGGGAFQPWTFGYQGRASNGNRGLATLYDTSVDYTVNAHVGLTAYFGHASGGSVIRSIYPDGPRANFGYLELNYKF